MNQFTFIPKYVEICALLCRCILLLRRQSFSNSRLACVCTYDVTVDSGDSVCIHVSKRGEEKLFNGGWVEVMTYVGALRKTQ